MLKVSRIALLSLWGTIFLPAHAQNAGAPISSSTQAQLNQLVANHEGWGPENSTDHIALTMVETSRSREGISYRLQAPGAPKDKTYSIVNWPVTAQQPIVQIDGVTLDAKGIAICAGMPTTCGNAATPNDPIDNMTNPVPGEPVRLGLISSDGKVKLFTKTVPIPIAGVDRGCKLNLVLLTPAAEAVLLQANGFHPSTEATLSCRSEKEAHDATVHLDAKGGLSTALLPYVAGLDHGTLNCTLRTAKCSPSAKVPWGKTP